MDRPTFTVEVHRLQARAADSIAKAVQEAQAQLKYDLQRLQTASLAELKRAAIPTHASIPAAPKQILGSDSFQAALLEPTVAVDANGTVLHVHSVVLRDIPYFAALLDGMWRDAMTPAINLPCSTAEFILILKRFYTDKPLGCSALPVPDCASALRICAAAAMLPVEDRLPELADMLEASVRSPEDATMVAAAGNTLPAQLRSVMSRVTGSCTLTEHDIIDLITKSNTQQAYEATNAILASRRGSLDASVIATAAKLVLESADSSNDASHRITWAGRIAHDFLSCETATSVFRHAIEPIHKDSQPHIGCPSFDQIPGPTKAAWHAAFLAHLQRCAEKGCLAEGFALMPDAEDHLSARRRMRCDGACTCRSSIPGNYFRLGENHAKDLARAVRRARTGRAQFAGELARLTPSLLMELLREEVIAALGSDADTVLSRIASDPKCLLQWATAPRLALVPMTLRRNICIGLAKQLDALKPDLATAVVETLR